ncbi:ketopantoate reductase family protein [Oceanobacillus senegalensis]|uniref:ketopantoate reductase family protein n=1 Tax=Oceanobacillus senegalensis TaxID=1936063 RepID=UPI000A305887|nr:2-dehydropantoate 2-reductase [Oceanobacillus senegalensis]
MKIGIVGAGAVGSYFGALLQKFGHHVTFLARGKHLAAMQENGLLVKREEGTFTIKGTFTDNPNDLSESELILFCVKSNDTKQVAEQLLPILNDNAKILTMQNGVDNEEVLTEVFDSSRIFSCATYVQIKIEEPGIVKQQGRVKLVIGEIDHLERNTCSTIVETLQKTGIDTKHTGNILEKKWRKFLWNITFNPLSAITTATIGEILDDKHLRKTAESVCSEAMNVASKMGITLDKNRTLETTFSNAERAKSHKTSMLQDRLNGKPMEVESMCGYVIRKSQRINVSVPTIRTLYSILNYLNQN